MPVSYPVRSLLRLCDFNLNEQVMTFYHLIKKGDKFKNIKNLLRRTGSFMPLGIHQLSYHEVIMKTLRQKDEDCVL